MNPRYKNLDSLLRDHDRKQDAIRQRLAQFRAIPAEKYFYELVYCFMTPQSSAVNSLKAQQMLTTYDFQNKEFNPEPLLHQKEYYIRFHKTKARLLLEMKAHYGEIFNAVASGTSAVEKREWLVANVKGIGYKEATHFLRNIGRNEGLAILDRHILRNLKKHGIVRTPPPSLTRKTYLSIERRFQKFAEDVGIPVDELDLIFWSNEAGEILK
jgi:N-glycosylase/DNA lyase